METLFNDIIKNDSIYFRGIHLGDPISKVIDVEGESFEANVYSNPYYKYFFEVGEMEEITIYYKFNAQEKCVEDIELIFIQYPDYYWKKEGHTNETDFFNLLQNNQLQAYSALFLNTRHQLINHFTAIFKKEPSVVKKDVVFDQAYQNFTVCSWEIENELRFSIMCYIDDRIENNVKNFMKIWLRDY
jgi:hypothetical protein